MLSRLKSRPSVAHGNGHQRASAHRLPLPAHTANHRVRPRQISPLHLTSWRQASWLLASDRRLSQTKNPRSRSFQQLPFVAQRRAFATTKKNFPNPKVEEQIENLGYQVVSIDHTRPLQPKFKLNSPLEQTPTTPNSSEQPDLNDQISANHDILVEITSAREQDDPRIQATLLKWQNGQQTEAIREIIDLASEFNAKLGQWHAQSVTAMELLAMMYRDTGRLDECYEIWKRICTYRQVRNESSLDAACSYKNYGPVLLLRGEIDEAEKYLKLARQIFNQSSSKFGSGTLDDTQLSVLEEEMEASMALMHVYEKLPKVPELEEELRYGYELNSRLRGDTHPLNANFLGSLATIYAGKGDLVEAQRLLRRAADIHEGLLTDPEDEGYEFILTVLKEVEERLVELAAEEKKEKEKGPVAAIEAPKQSPPPEEPKEEPVKHYLKEKGKGGKHKKGRAGSNAHHGH